MARKPLAQRIEERIERVTESGCWLWLGKINVDGYAKILLDGPQPKTVAVHRITYEAAKGPIPAGLQVDHLCRVRCCVNPAHLEAVSHHENQLRGFGWSGRNARKTHCRNGHPLEVGNIENGLWQRLGYRKCLTCRRATARRYKARVRTLRQPEIGQ